MSPSTAASGHGKGPEGAGAVATSHAVPDRAPAAREDGLPPKRRVPAILGSAIAVTMTMMDISLVNIALPSISHSLGGTPGQIIWVVTAFQLGTIVALLPGTALVQRFDVRRVFPAALLAYAVCALGCTQAGTLATLAVLRFAQGLASAPIAGGNAAVIRLIYPKRLLGRGIALNAFVAAFSTSAGPVVGSLVLSLASWRALFWIDIPLALTAAVLMFVFLPSTVHRRAPPDGAGLLLCVTTFAMLVIGLNGLAQSAPPEVMLPMVAAGLVVGAVFVRREARLGSPLLPVDLLRQSDIALGLAALMAGYMAQAIAFIDLPFLLIRQLGRSQADAGWTIAAWPVAVAVSALFAGRLSDRLSPPVMAGGGLSILAFGLGALAVVATSLQPIAITACVAVAGFGFGMFQTPNNRSVLAAAPLDRSAGVSALMACARWLGAALSGACIVPIFRLSPAHGALDVLWLAALVASVGIGASLAKLALAQQRRLRTP